MGDLRKIFSLTFILLFWFPCFSEESEETKAAQEIRAIGGHAFLNLKTNRIGEINLNRNSKASDQTMMLVARCSDITDRSLSLIGKLGKLEKLWLHDTSVTGEAVRDMMSKLSNLKQLHLQRTNLTIEEVQLLRRLFVGCEILYEKD